MSDLGTPITRTWDESLALWPALEITLADLTQHAQRLEISPSNLERYGAELCLALACARGSANAIVILEAHFWSSTRQAIASVRAASDFADEALQALRERLYVGPPPRLATYAARGPLQGWLRRAALNVALNLTARQPRASDVDPMQVAVSCDTSPPVAHQVVAQAALDEAAARLTAAQRELLRLHAQGLSIDELSSLRGGHRSTMARSLVAIRSRLLTDVVTRFASHFDMAPAEAQATLGELGLELDATALIGRACACPRLCEKAPALDQNRAGTRPIGSTLKVPEAKYESAVSAASNGAEVFG